MEKLVMNEYMHYFKNEVIKYHSRKEVIEKSMKIMKEQGLDYETIYKVKDQMEKENKLQFSNGEVKAFRAWQNTIRNNRDAEVIEMSEFLWDEEVAGFICALRTAGVDRFYFTNTSTAVMENLHGFVAAGCKIGKTVTLEKDELFREPQFDLGIEIIL